MQLKSVSDKSGTLFERTRASAKCMDSEGNKNPPVDDRKNGSIGKINLYVTVVRVELLSVNILDISTYEKLYQHFIFYFSALDNTYSNSGYTYMEYHSYIYTWWISMGVSPSSASATCEFHGLLNVKW